MIDARRFARLVTDVVVRRPAVWRLFRGPLRGMFDRLAPTWDSRIGPHHLGALGLALADVPPPGRILDLGTGTGVVAKALAERYPEAEVVGIDLSRAMVEHARAQLPPGVAGRVRFEVGDASALDCTDGEFELVVLSFSRGDATPIYVPSGRLRDELGRRGFAEFAEFSAAPATAFRAERR